MPNPVHAIRNNLLVAVAPQQQRRGIGTALVNQMRLSGMGPFNTKAEPDTAVHAFWHRLGAARYQVCPPQRLASTSRAVLSWAEQHAASATSATQVPVPQLVEAIAERYWWQHTSWAPIRSTQAVRSILEPHVTEETDVAGTGIVLRHGRITAVCDLYGDEWPDRRIACAEAVDAATPDARGDVAACMAHVILHVGQAGGRTLEFEGHVPDPHFYPLLATIPGIFGPPCELLEVPA